MAPVFALFAKDGCVDAGLKDAFDVYLARPFSTRTP